MGEVFKDKRASQRELGFPDAILFIWLVMCAYLIRKRFNKPFARVTSNYW